jgi:hypothetical protein
MAKNPRFDDDYWIWSDKKAGIVLDRPPYAGDTDNSGKGIPWMVVFRDEQGDLQIATYVRESPDINAGVDLYSVYVKSLQGNWSLEQEWRQLSRVIIPTTESWEDIKEMYFTLDRGSDLEWVIYRAGRLQPHQSINKYTIV